MVTRGIGSTQEQTQLSALRKGKQMLGVWEVAVAETESHM
jgi:hypothetical protein